MTHHVEKSSADVVVIGSGTCGATIARELSRRGHSVIVLERGVRMPLREDVMAIGKMADEITVADGLKAIRGVVAGGSTGLYFALAEAPPVAEFLKLGIDLSREAREIHEELPIGELPDGLLGPQSLRLRECAGDLGFDFRKNPMLIDQSKCHGGYSYDAKWKALAYLDEAVNHGARLIQRAAVTRVLVEGGRAIGVEYRRLIGKMPVATRRIFAGKVVVCAGSLGTADILLRSGLKETGKAGYFCDPGFAVFGLIPGLGAKDNFVGCMSSEYDDDISLGDGNMPRSLHTLLMLGTGKFRHALAFGDAIGIGVKIKDTVGGSLTDKGAFRKRLGDEDIRRLKRGEEQATLILKKAGAKSIFKGKTVGANPGGVVPLGDMLDDSLQTRIRDLHVCDASVLPAQARVIPTVTLVCLGKYLARRIHDPQAWGIGAVAAGANNREH